MRPVIAKITGQIWQQIFVATKFGPAVLCEI